MPPWYVPLLLLLAVWVFADAPMWLHRERMKPSVHDRSTIWVNTVLGYAGFISSLALAPWAKSKPALALTPRIAWGGILVTVLGTLLRVWSMRTLGRFHTGTLQTQPDQSVVERGPYRLVRHTSYLGATSPCSAWASRLAHGRPCS